MPFLSSAGAYSVVLFAGHLSYIILMITFLPTHVVSRRKINEHKFQMKVTEIGYTLIVTPFGERNLVASNFLNISQIQLTALKWIIIILLCIGI